MSLNQQYTHLIFGTKRRCRTITEANKRSLYAFLYYLLKEQGCYVYRINGVEDHVHILFNKNPRTLIEDLVRRLKSVSSRWMKESGLFPYFDGWCKEYCALSKGREQLPQITQYIINQEEHHKGVTFEEELRQIYAEEGAEFHPKAFL